MSHCFCVPSVFRYYMFHFHLETRLQLAGAFPDFLMVDESVLFVPVSELEDPADCHLATPADRCSVCSQNILNACCMVPEIIQEIAVCCSSTDTKNPLQTKQVPLLLAQLVNIVILMRS